MREKSNEVLVRLTNTSKVEAVRSRYVNELMRRARIMPLDDLADLIGEVEHEATRDALEAIYASGAEGSDIDTVSSEQSPNRPNKTRRGR